MAADDTIEIIVELDNGQVDKTFVETEKRAEKAADNINESFQSINDGKVKEVNQTIININDSTNTLLETTGNLSETIGGIIKVVGIGSAAFNLFGGNLEDLLKPLDSLGINSKKLFQ